MKRMETGGWRLPGGALLRAGLIAGGLGFGLPAAAQEVIAPSPVVGTWVVAVTIEGSPALTLPNLVTFSVDGTVIVAAPPLLPELPGEEGEEHFSAGHGAWVARGQNGADVRFAFLVSDEDGKLASINTVNGAIEVDPQAEIYIGQFSLAIIGADGGAKGTAGGTWHGVRLEAVSEGPVGVPR